MKRYFIDTTATVIFFTIIAATTELLIAGLEPRQVLMTRLMTIPAMIITGRPYGLWRDWFFAKTKPKRAVAKVLSDVLAFISFQVPVYVATLLIAGATASEIGAAVSASIVFMVLLSRPFGIYLEIVRKWAGTAVR
ncbi:MAG: L-alanine exporter AlaE [Rhodobacteraceae bacterium]|nr:L-alanine exporter AlaE [Paracoccaceae bacterium]